MTIAAIAMADDLISSPPVVSPQFEIEPEPRCAAGEYENGAGEERCVMTLHAHGKKTDSEGQGEREGDVDDVMIGSKGARRRKVGEGSKWY